MDDKLSAREARDLAAYLKHERYRDLQICFCPAGLSGTFDCALCAGRNHVALALHLADALDRVEEQAAEVRRLRAVNDDLMRGMLTHAVMKAADFRARREMRERAARVADEHSRRAGSDGQEAMALEIADAIRALPDT